MFPAVSKFPCDVGRFEMLFAVRCHVSDDLHGDVSSGSDQFRPPYPETNLEYSSDSNSYSSILSLNPRMASSLEHPIHCSQSFSLKTKFQNIDGNYAFKHDKLVTKHV